MYVGSHIILDPNGGNPQTKIYKVVTPTSGDHAANKQYVDDQIDAYLPLTGGEISGKVDIRASSSGGAAAIRTIGSINVKANGQSIDGSNNFIAHKDYVRDIQLQLMVTM